MNCSTLLLPEVCTTLHTVIYVMWVRVSSLICHLQAITLDTYFAKYAAVWRITFYIISL